jgi:LacI family transcriptional regulator
MTLEEVAALAGVSRATVSRVVNNQPHVNAEKRARVRQIIRACGYQPNPAARALARGHSHTIGLVIPTALAGWLSSAYFTFLFQGAANACEQRGYNMMLSPQAAQTPEAYDHIISSGYVDGLVVTTSAVGAAYLDHLIEHEYPFVLLGRHLQRNDLNTVYADNLEAAQRVVAYLVSLGYSRIATITGSAVNATAVDRLDGFLAGIRSLGLTCPPEYIAQGSFTEEGSYEAMQSLLALADRPQAVFCCNDQAAVAALRAIRDAGLAVPDDIALVGFDDLPLAAAVDPPLTTVHHPVEQMGLLAASLLIDQLEAMAANPQLRPVPQHIVVGTEIVVRGSCGAGRRQLAHVAN